MVSSRPGLSFQSVWQMTLTVFITHDTVDSTSLYQTETSPFPLQDFYGGHKVSKIHGVCPACNFGDLLLLPSRIKKSVPFLNVDLWKYFSSWNKIFPAGYREEYRLGAKFKIHWKFWDEGERWTKEREEDCGQGRGICIRSVSTVSYIMRWVSANGFLMSSCPFPRICIKHFRIQCQKCCSPSPDPPPSWQEIPFHLLSSRLSSPLIRCIILTKEAYS